MTTTSSTVEKLVLRRTYKAPRERVFAAWTQADLIKQWLKPGDAKVLETEVDARVGGTYHILFQKADGEKLDVRGVYREVREPERLVFTWRWDEDDASLERDTIVTLEFNDLGGETEFVLTHENFASSESREGHSSGWSTALDALPSVL